MRCNDEQDFFTFCLMFLQEKVGILESPNFLFKLFHKCYGQHVTGLRESETRFLLASALLARAHPWSPSTARFLPRKPSFRMMICSVSIVKMRKALISIPLSHYPCLNVTVKEKERRVSSYFSLKQNWLGWIERFKKKQEFFHFLFLPIGSIDG